MEERETKSARSSGFPTPALCDYPFEWTLCGEWPLCLSKPVSRIPMSMSSWYHICASLQNPRLIDLRSPGKSIDCTDS
jgi:hypothetical protein